MKVLVVALVLFVASVAFAKSSEKSNRCDTEADCSASECCVYGDNPYRHGRCYTLGKEGSRCSVSEAKLSFHGGKYYGYCPCQEGLQCVGKENKNTFSDQRCQDPTGTATPKTRRPYTGTWATRTWQPYTRTYRPRTKTPVERTTVPREERTTTEEPQDETTTTEAPEVIRTTLDVSSEERY